ncbi:MAG: glycosyltransferase [Bacteroidetes bacterium]|nr:glycosyltransferase [Bacteroidota bacterium]
MKITTCQFNDSYFPIMDGVGITAHNYARWLNEKYGRTVLVAPKVKDYEDDEDYRVYRFKSVLLPGMNPYRVGLPLIDITFKKKLKKLHFDIVHGHSPFISGQLAQQLARKRGIPLVATFHTKFRDDFRKVLNNNLFVDFLMNLTLDFYNSADVVWVPNKSTGQTLREYGYKGKFEIMPNGTDMEIPDKSKRLKLRKAGLEITGADGNQFTLLFVGQHRWEKNVRMIIDSLRLLSEKNVIFQMIFVGEGYAAKEMKKLVKEYNLNDKVIFAGLVTDRNKLKSIYSCADLFVFPSIYDNSPLVIQEAAAFDVPSVVVKKSSAAEGITDKVNGFLIDDNPQALFKLISEVKKYPEVIKLAGEGARKSIYKPWEGIVDLVYQRYVEIIEENVHKRKSVRPAEDDDLDD